MYLEVNFGLEIFLRAYNYMQNLPERDDNNEQLRSLLGPANMRFVPLLIQLLVCEDSFYSSEAR
jgi:NIMA (never in mitosis gene a)-related kinase